MTNAVLTDVENRAVVGPHLFLLLEDAGMTWLAVPLFSRRGPGSVPLEEALKGGLADGWVGRQSYVSRYQHWKIPETAIVAASASEVSNQANRRTYADGALEKLPEMVRWTEKNRCDFRQL